MKIKKIKPITIIAGLTMSAGFIIGIGGWFGGGASIPSDTMTRGLVGYWNFDEGTGPLVLDKSNQGNDGMINDGGAGNPVAYWTFDEGAGTTAYDYTGSNNGTLTNGPVWTSSGRVGGALQFDGSDDYVLVGDKSNLESMSALTLAAWVKTTDTTGGEAIITKWYTGTVSYVLRTDFSTASKAGFSTNGGSTVDSVSTTSINDGK